MLVELSCIQPEAKEFTIAEATDKEGRELAEKMGEIIIDMFTALYERTGSPEYKKKAINALESVIKANPPGNMKKKLSILRDPSINL